MNRIAILKNTIQGYAWGSRSFIPELAGLPLPWDKPLAEMWIGAHPKASSRAILNNKKLSLETLIKDDPSGTLGASVAEKFACTLPFLFKVLAAARPLSIQAHPDKRQAGQGFDRENKDNLPMDAAARNYKDRNHKPELICALTPMWALKGFRRNEEIIDLMDKAGASSLVETGILRNHQGGDGLKRFFNSLLAMDKDVQRDVVKRIAGAVKGIPGPPFEWLIRLHNEYPGDIGVLSPLFLNLVYLKPSEAIYIGPGELHAYLEGAGLELMANSDNVIRGGLTPKHVDKKELMAILEFAPHDPEIIGPKKWGPNEEVYHTDSDEFRLSVITLGGKHREGTTYIGPAERGAEIIICMEGGAGISAREDGGHIKLLRGMSVFIPASVAGYTITGNGTFYKAAVPIKIS